MLEQISSYRLEGEIARGGMGIVYRGVHTVFEEVVAIKAIFPELTLNPELRARFVNEAKIQRRLQHPNIVQIREFLIDQGRFYIVMELIEGETLAQRLKRVGAPLPAKEALEIFRQALQGLGFAHAQGVIHRDMKPSNIMLTRDAVAKLTDFGIARAVGVPGLTQTGMVLGTPAYMAPEQIQGHQVDKRADIYSLGVTLYEMVAGRVPFEKPKDSDSDYQVLRAHIEEPPPPPSRFAATIPPFVEGAILRAMAKRPDERFASCEAFEATLVPPELPVTIRVIPAIQASVAPTQATPERAAVPKAVAPQRAPAKIKRKTGYVWALLVLAVVLAVGGYWFYRLRVPILAFGIANLRFADSDTAPPRASTEYKPEEEVRIFYEVTGYERDKNSYIAVVTQHQVLAPDGKPFFETKTIEVKQQAGDQAGPVKCSFHFDLPPWAPPGHYTINIQGEDQIAHKTESAAPTFTVDAPPVETSATLVAKNIELAASRDGAAISPPVFTAGQTIWLRFRTVGMKANEQGQILLTEDWGVTGPDGKPIFERKDDPMVDERFIYPPPFYPYREYATLGSSAEAGEYRFHAVLHDKIGGADFTIDQPFTITKP
jgi:predicted Ser/Thr protein kinase